MSINIRNLSKSFGNKSVLRNFSAKFSSGKTTVIKGDSGVGKTTLLRIISGLEKADEGTVEGLDGKVIAYMFQEDRLFGSLTAYENVAAVCKDPEIIRKSMQICCCEEFADKYPSELSGGMSRRVSLCRTVAYALENKDNAIVLLDEPFKGFDAKLREKICAMLNEAFTDISVIAIMHDEESLFSEFNTVYIT